ncbi:hypothetical protein, partial [Agrobacterium tumefaciens]|uniref:hypothetical protein n=1 Tax=Agrobacterium tumefaciens TaxID=358 RepID=UPI001B8A7B32
PGKFQLPLAQIRGAPHNPGKFQLPLAQIRGAPQNGPELTSKWIISTGQGQEPSTSLFQNSFLLLKGLELSTLSFSGSICIKLSNPGNYLLSGLAGMGP